MNEPDSRLTYQIDPTPEETQRACEAVVRASLPRSRGNLTIFLLYAGVGLAAAMFARETFVRTFLIGIGAVLASLLAFQQMARRNHRQLLRNDPHARESHFIELGPDGIRTWCEHIDARYPWNETIRVIDNREFFLFVRASGVGAAIPKRQLAPERQRELRARLGDWSPVQVEAVDGSAD